MNYYGPKPLLKEGADPEDWDEDDLRGYHYCQRQGSSSRSRIWPLGYCRGLDRLMTSQEEYDERMGANSPAEKFEEGWNSEMPSVEDAKRTIRVHQELEERFGEKFHDHAHDTKEEAQECYTEYCLDVKMATYEDEPSEFLRYFGVNPDQLSEPVTGGDVPADVKGETCRHPECTTIVAYPTVQITGASGGGGMTYHVCGHHCNREDIESWYSTGESFGTM